MSHMNFHAKIYPFFCVLLTLMIKKKMDFVPEMAKMLQNETFLIFEKELIFSWRHEALLTSLNKRLVE